MSNTPYLELPFFLSEAGTYEENENESVSAATWILQSACTASLCQLSSQPHSSERCVLVVSDVQLSHFCLQSCLSQYQLLSVACLLACDVLKPISLPSLVTSVLTAARHFLSSQSVSCQSIMRVSSAFSRRVANDSSADSKRTVPDPSPRPPAVVGGLKAAQAVARPSLRLTPSDANLFDVLHSRRAATLLTSDTTHNTLLTHASFVHDLQFDQLLQGHTGCVNRLAWNYSATLLASGSDDCCVRLWDFTKPDRPCRLNLQTGHQANIFAVGFLQSDTSIVSAGMDCSVRVCRIDREECIGVYNCHQARVKELCVDPANDNVFLTAGEDGTCRQFDMREPHHCAAAHTGGRRMFMHREFAGTAPCANAVVSTPSLQAKCVDINPLLPQYFLLSANDHYIRVFDRRYLPPSHSSTASSPAYAKFAAAHLKRGHQSTFSQWDETGRQIVASYSGEQVYVYEFDRRADEEEGSRYRTYSKTGERVEEEMKRQYEEEKMEEVELNLHTTPQPRPSTLPTLNLDSAFPVRLTATSTTSTSFASPSNTPSAVLPPELLARAEQLTAQGNSEYDRHDYSAAVASYNSALLIVSSNQTSLTSRILTLRSAALIARHYPSDLHLALDDAMQAYRVDRQNEKALVAAVDCQRKLGRLSRAMRLCQYCMVHVRGGEVEREMSAMMDEMREERKKKTREQKKATESKAAGARGRRREQREKAKQKDEERKHRRTKRSKSSAATGLSMEEKEKEKERERKRRKARTESEDEVRAMETEVTSTEETEEKRKRRMNRGRSEERKERAVRGGKDEKEREEEGKEEKSAPMADDAFDELMMDTLRMTREQWMAKYGDDEDEADPMSDNDHDVDASLVEEEGLEASEEAEEEEEEDEEDVSMSELEQAQEAELVESIARRRPARRVVDKEHETSSQSASSLSDTPIPPPLPLPPPVPTAPPSSAASLPPVRTRVHRSFLQRYLGHANVQTDIKESTFWGPYILSGSDDGHIFIWERSSARLVCVIKASDDVINCAAAGTLIALADGTSVPIEEVQPGSAVLSYVAAGPEKGSTEGLAVMRVDELMDRGERECVELLFDDGRTLVCTPDHRIRTADGRWVEAGQLVEGADEVAVGVEFANSSARRETADDSWRLKTRRHLGYDLDMRDKAQHSLAFARLLGFLLTDGIATDTGWCRLYLGHQLDAEAVLRDVLLLTGTQPTTVAGHRTLNIELPKPLQQAMQALGVDAGKRLRKVSRFPPFVTDVRCPVPVVREFLGGLFGGDGHTLQLGHRSEREKVLAGLRFCCTRSCDVAAEQHEVLYDELVRLLERCGVDCSSGFISKFNTVAPNMLTKAGYSQLQQLQSEGHVVDDSEDGDTDPYVYPAVDKVRYGVHRDGRVLPLFRVKLVRRRAVGVRHVYDLSVPNSRSDDHRSFVANGIVVHNCVRGHPYSSVIASSGIDSEIHVWSVQSQRVREEGEECKEAERARADGRGQVSKEEFVQLVDGNQRRMERDVSLSPSTLLSLILQSLGRQSGPGSENPLAILQMLNSGEVVIRPARGGGGDEEGEEEEEEDGEFENGDANENDEDEEDDEDEC